MRISKQKFAKFVFIFCRYRMKIFQILKSYIQFFRQTGKDIIRSCIGIPKVHYPYAPYKLNQ